jgi:hypothetical protein
MDIVFNDLKPHITGALKESCQITDAIIHKIADEIHHIETTTVEPGVEMAQGLSKIIDTIIKDSVRLGGDLSIVAKGILIGAFRSNRYMKIEAHKTIHLILQEIVRSVLNCKGDIYRAVDGLLAGIVAIAKEHNLNVQEALIVGTEDILFSIKEIDAKYVNDIKTIVQKKYKELRIEKG